MSLYDAVLSGVQGWYRKSIQELLRANRPVRKQLGERLLKAGKPVTLSEAEDLLDSLLTLREVARETGAVVHEPFFAKVRDLRKAVLSALSRCGTGCPDQVRELLEAGEVETVLSETEGFSLAEFSAANATFGHC